MKRAQNILWKQFYFYFFILLTPVFIFSCKQNNNTNKENSTPTKANSDYLYLKDWSGTIDSNNYMLETEEGNFVPLPQYPNPEFLEATPYFVSYEYFDMGDADYPGIIGMVFSGGAHCCFTYTIYFPLGDNKYEHIWTYTTGGDGLTIRDGMFHVDFYEHLGYFYTCYACTIEEIRGREGREIPSYFRVGVLKNKEIELTAPDQKLNEEIIKDLEVLKTMPIMDLEDDGYAMDDGIRKAYAQEVITYTINNQLEFDESRAFFMKYYTGSDSVEIFNDIWEYTSGILFGNMEHAQEKNIESFKKLYDKMKMD